MSDVFNLPASWALVTVAELGRIVSGGTPSTKEASHWGGNINWISPSDLTGYTSKHISIGAKSITEAGLKNSSATVMPAGSIHFSSRAPIGYTVISSEAMTTNQGFKSLVPSEGVFNEFVYYYFKSAKQLAESQATGTTFKEISGTAFGKLPVPLPPTNEQHRIVAKIEELFSELDKGIENLKTAREQLKVYRQALLKHAFEGKLTVQWRAANPDKLEPAAALLARIQTEREQRYRQQLQQWEAVGGGKPKVPKPLSPLSVEKLAELPELPEGWGWVRLGDLTIQITKGASPNWQGINYVDDSSQVLFVTSENVRENFIDITKPKYVEMAFNEKQPNTILKNGDLLVNIVGASIGRASLFNLDICANVNQAVSVVRILAVELRQYISLLLNTHFASIYYAKNAVDVARANLSLVDVANIPVPLCSLNEIAEIQSEVEACLSGADQLDQTLATSLQKSEALRQSILKKAFSGQLVAQDANDEPASVLLERIKAEKAAAMAKPRKAKRVVDPKPVRSNVVTFSVKLPNISATDLHAGILARAYQHHENAPKYLGYFGHVKAEKIAHLVEAHLGIDLERAPIKDAAGPNDYPHLMKVESRARKANWFDVRKKKDADAYEFSKKHGFDALLLKTRNALGERAAEVDALIELLLPLNSRQAEILATLYAAWNNLLLQGQSPGDEAIVHEARENWHAAKLKIERDKFFWGLQWMYDNGLVPSGKGRYVGGKASPKSTRKPS